MSVHNPMRLRIVTPPALEPLSVPEARVRAALGENVADGLIASLVKVGRYALDGKDGLLGRALIQQTWELTLRGFPQGSDWHGRNCSLPLAIRMPLPPLMSVESVRYRDSAGMLLTLAPDRYRVVVGDPGLIMPGADGSWPATAWDDPEAVRITFSAGYGATGDAVPEPIRQAIAMSISLGASTAARDPLLAREQVDGVGSFDYAAGLQSAAMINGEIARLIGPYRVWGGIS